MLLILGDTYTSTTINSDTSDNSEIFVTEVHILKGKYPNDQILHKSAMEVSGRTEEESRKRATDVVEATNIQADLKSKSPEEKVFSAMSNFVNGAGKSRVKNLANLICNDHRTLQQSAFGLFMECIAVWDKSCKAGRFDGRNEFTVKASEKIVDTFEYDLMGKEATSPASGGKELTPVIFIDREPSVPCI